ncbi:MAG: alpha-amylase [Flavobacteriaceae bacterium]|nr:alpha-amylase [Flavobacteriaceae bacterium]
MKQLVTFAIALTLLVSCKDKNEEIKLEAGTVDIDTKALAPVSDAMIESAVIYEANIRQYSREGSFDAFTKDIPQLKQLGVKIIWIMPIFPISETNRKATGGDFASLIEDEAERKKMLGSYYAVSDFTKVNPEFGNIEDFRKLVKTAHDNGMYVILDWVPNHTGWDHIWISEHPDYYTKNADGEITDPLNDDGTPVGWADVADLNYDNQEMRKEMIEDMMHWVTEENIDGFRCDVAGSVPLEFWEEAIPQLRAKKELFMLAEAWEHELMKDNLFDMGYGWDTHHVMNYIAKGEKKVEAWDERMNQINSIYGLDDILMNFITNHDENSWNGSVEERMGDASEIMLALSYVAPGMPLIYSGQEYDLKHRLKFFEKDEIPKIKGKSWPLLEKLGKLKNQNDALNGGKQAASYTRTEVANENVLVFNRAKNKSEITFIGNLSKEEQTIDHDLTGMYLDYITNTKIDISIGRLVLKPWEYKILIH